MDIEEAKEYFRNCLDDEYNFKNATRNKDKKAIEVVLSELEKKDKIIEDIKFINNNNKPHIAQQKIREYFTNKVEEGKG